MSSRIDQDRTGQRPRPPRTARERAVVGRAPARPQRGSGRLDLDLQPPVALLTGGWDDDGRALTQVLLRSGFQVLGPDGGTGTPQLVVLPADPAPAVLAAVRELAQAHPGRAVRCGLVGSAVGPGTGPDGNADAWAEVQVLLLDTGTQAQREAAAAGATAVVGALLTRVLAEPVGAAH